MLSETKNTAAMRTIARARVLRSYLFSCSSMALDRFLDVHRHDIGQQAYPDKRPEEHDVPEVDHPLGDGAKVGEETHARDGIDQETRQPALEETLHQIEPAHQEQETDDGGKDEA